MSLSKAQKSIAKSDARFRVVAAGRRFGKTYISTMEMAKHARYPDKNIFYVAPSYRQAKQTVWQPLKIQLSKMNWIKKVNESDLTIQLTNDSVISLRGADNFDSLRGVGLDFLVMDEFAYIKEQAWTEVLRPTLSDRLGKAMFISTPAGLGNWAYDLYIKGQDETQDNWQSWQFTSLDGCVMSEQEIEDARKDLDERTFRQEYLAAFETYSGVIYYAFEPSKHIKKFEGADELWTTLKKAPLLLMIDFNVNPMSAAVGIQMKDHIHIIDEIVIYGSNTLEVVQEFRNRYGDRAITAYPDPAGVQNKTSAGGNTDIKILQNAGCNVKYKRKHPLVKDRINAVNSALSSGKLVIDPKCKRVIESLTKHTYKEGTQVPDKDSGYDHMSDALGYGVEFIYPIKKDYGEIQQPRGWGVQTS